MSAFRNRTGEASLAFTLIEMIMALTACVVVLSAIYGVFSRAVHLRDDAIERTREMRIRARALSVLRNDLQNARFSGERLAASLLGTEESRSSFPGYLRFTTTTARGAASELIADLQEVEYYIVSDPENSGRKAGILVRTVERNLLAQTREQPPEEALLAGVAAMELSFFDGQSWNPTWEATPEDKTPPQAVRVTIELAPSEDGRIPQPIEVLIPWTAQPATEETPA
jgi:type II secretion system protein J